MIMADIVSSAIICLPNLFITDYFYSKYKNRIAKLEEFELKAIRLFLELGHRAGFKIEIVDNKQ